MANEPSQRPSPEQFLAQAELEERRKRRGRLKVFLGYTSGVGKSFQMFDEGRRRSERGEDVVVCAVQPEYSPDVRAVLRKLEIIPSLKIGGQDCIDVEAVLRRRPQVVLVDGLAYENPPGSRNAERWQDVEQILDAGISVVASINLQFLERLRDEVGQITGKRAPYTIPGGYLDSNADEIVVVDAPALDRFSQGAATADRVAPSADAHKLSRLRELALLVAAGVVDRQLESYLRAHGMEQPMGVQERILVCVTPRSNAAAMLESGRRNADRFHGELYAVYVRQPALSQRDQVILSQNLEYARELGAHVESLNGLDAVEAILRFAQDKGITQICIGQSQRHGAWRRLWRSLIYRLIRRAEGIDVIIYPHQQSPA